MVGVGVCAFVVCVDVGGGEEGDKQGARGGVAVAVVVVAIAIAVAVAPIVAVVDVV